jgi:DNA-binding MarR family transcriptional regulator
MAGPGLASVEDILARVENLLRTVEELPGSCVSASDFEADLVEAAHRALRSEKKRSELFGAELFANPGWAMLLHLFVSSAEGRPVTSSGICAAAGVTETVALRHLAVLVTAKLVRRQPHPGNPGAIELALTPAGKKRLCDYFSQRPRDRDAAAA